MAAILKAVAERLLVGRSFANDCPTNDVIVWGQLQPENEMVLRLPLAHVISQSRQLFPGFTWTSHIIWHAVYDQVGGRYEFSFTKTDEVWPIRFLTCMGVGETKPETSDLARRRVCDRDKISFGGES